MLPEKPIRKPARYLPDYRTVWRWHFYAGLFCIPFVLILSLSGSIYLFKTEIDDWLERDYDNLTLNAKPTTPAAQVQAALQALPDSRFASYELPATTQSAARVVVRQGERSIRVFVHPQTLQVLGSMPEDERFMRWIFRLHGELLLGDRGSNIVETAASWTIVMILTGLYLWWPKCWNGGGGILYPRLSRGGKVFWRDLHSVTGIWISVFALFLLFSGLPWSKFWGSYFKEMRRLTGTAVAQQDWANGSARAKPARSANEGGEHAGHSGSGTGRARTSDAPPNYDALDRVTATVASLNLPRPVVIAPARGAASEWTAKSMTPNRPQRVTLTLDQQGAITNREDFGDRHVIDQVVGYGIAAHEGRLFGVVNQALALLTAAGLVLLSVSGIVLWLRRRQPAELGAPVARVGWRISLAFLGLLVLLAAALPLFGGTLLLVLAVEKLILARLPGVRDWLGLAIPSRVSLDSIT